MIMKVKIITGERGSGKTTFLKKYVESLGSENTNIFGFYAENVSGKDEYVIHKLNSLEKAILCKRNSPETGNLKIRDFWFDEKAVRTGENWLNEGFDASNPVFIIDEVGMFEIKGYVWNDVIKKIIALDRGTLIITVRHKFLNEVIRKFNLENVEIIDVERNFNQG